ncbi:DEAD/DEAH box helicase [Bacillus alveayuensis]|uniref:DEAD/DEAH box helicase n=1 Tax=Aeribacillus alveayuensis TaxID=279215 RepID=UPI0005D0F0F2|nr:DEAD/DEAH box helicase [Bacillus alveayuensis]
MKPDNKSLQLLGVTRSKAKMYEYSVPEDHHIEINKDPARLFNLSIGILGQVAAQINLDTLDNESKDIHQLRQHLHFSARFFDSYLHTRLNEELEPYLLILGSASYYLSDLPGSALVLINHLDDSYPELETEGLESLLIWLLKGNFNKLLDETTGSYKKYIDELISYMVDFYKYGKYEEVLLEKSKLIRKFAYLNGTSRQLLFADIISAVIKKRIDNSVWRCIPKYTGLSNEIWKEVLQKSTVIKEFWPAQHLLGKHGLFNGKSGIVQMPTSAGKTKATEFMIRSAFLSNRTSLAVIVAPFRALCNEISNTLRKAFHNEQVNIDEISDVIQSDFEVGEILGRKQILVVTPEKLLYVLRHSSELAQGIGLIIYDEGHQFDSGSRGITYELLLTSLKSMIPETVQTVLISAVIKNAETVGNWLNGVENEVVSGTNLIPTYRTVAFSSWLDQLGRLEFVEQSDPENSEFFVPRVIESQKLKLRDRERRERTFPEKGDGKSIALYLGIKLVSNGSVAIFCGQKSSVTSLCEKIVDAFDRGLSLQKPIDISEKEEIDRIHYLYQCHLGDHAVATQCAKLGILTHHGNTPHGIRLSVEHAMKGGMAKFVICTSTLAQGVNLPIRYLIVTSIYQGHNRISVRDFHNLIGRTGRSGMHTEGSIIFADPSIYDQRRGYRTSWRWKQVKDLLEPTNSEPCASALLQIFEPLYNDEGERRIRTDILKFVQACVESPETVEMRLEKIASKLEDKGYTKEGLKNQFFWKMNIISSIESYLMAYGDDYDIDELAKGTLAYYLAEDEEKAKLIDLFKLLNQNIYKKVPNESKRKVFGKTLYGVRTSLEIETWLTENIHLIINCKSTDEFITVLWSIISQNINNSTFRKCDKPEVLKEITLGWIKGKPFYELFDIIKDSNARIISGSQRRNFNMDHIIDICENALAYDATLILGAIIELMENFHADKNIEDVVDNLKVLQKRMKYGLSSSLEIILYELGFSDRVVSIELASVIENKILVKDEVIKEIKQNIENIGELLKKYPSYFSTVFDNVVSK